MQKPPRSPFLKQKLCNKLEKQPNDKAVTSSTRKTSSRIKFQKSDQKTDTVQSKAVPTNKTNRRKTCQLEKVCRGKKCSKPQIFELMYSDKNFWVIKTGLKLFLSTQNDLRSTLKVKPLAVPRKSKTPKHNSTSNY